MVSAGTCESYNTINSDCTQRNVIHLPLAAFMAHATASLHGAVKVHKSKANDTSARVIPMHDVKLLSWHHQVALIQ